MPMPPVDHKSAAAATSNTPLRRASIGAGLYDSYDTPSSGLRPPSPRFAGRRIYLRGWREAPGEGSKFQMDDSIRHDVAAFHPALNVALRWGAGQGIVGWRNDQRTFANDVGERVDFERLVHNRIDHSVLEMNVGVRIAHRQHERSRPRSKLVETTEELLALVVWKVHVDQNQGVIAGSHFFHGVLSG